MAKTEINDPITGRPMLECDPRFNQAANDHYGRLARERALGAKQLAGEARAQADEARVRVAWVDGALWALRR